MKAVFVFCEGNHDVAFVSRSLGQVAGATWRGEPIGQLPSPLGPVRDPGNPKPKVESIIVQRYGNRALGSLRLPEAAHAPVPVFEAVVATTDTLYVLVACHGDAAAKSAVELLADVKVLLDPAYGTDLKQIAAAFLFDADGGLVERQAKFATEYAALLDGHTAPGHSTWSQGSIPVGLYVFHDPGQRKGTLEEILAPLVEAQWQGRWSAADNYLTLHVQSGDRIATNRAERLKAQIGVTGQFRFPGDPMTRVIADREHGLQSSHFAGPESQALVKFLKGVPW